MLPRTGSGTIPHITGAAILLLAACTNSSNGNETEGNGSGNDSAAEETVQETPDAIGDSAVRGKTPEDEPDGAAPEEPNERSRAPSTPASFVGRWAAAPGLCANSAWRFTESSLRTPAGSVCEFSDVRRVNGGYDIAARCTAEGSQGDEILKIRFAESARAMLFESKIIADAGLTYCGRDR